MKKYPTPHKAATMQDVAHDAGVSMKTVSRVVNNEAGVSEKLKVKVEASIAKLKFKPNLNARNMASKRTNLIGFPLPEGANSFFYRILDTAIETCRNSAYSMLIHHVYLGSNQSHDSIIDALDLMRNSSLAEGILLPPPYSNDEKINSWLIKNGIPYAAIGQISAFRSDIHSWTNIADGIKQITQHLIDLGHRRIAFISGPEHLIAASERKRGFYETLQLNHINIDPALFAKGDFTFTSGLMASRELLSQPNRPTAIVCSNDTTAFAAMQTAHQMGINIPQELSITGFDDITEATMNTIALTTIHQPIEEMTSKAIKALLQQLQSGHVEPYDAFCQSKIVIRHSTGPVPNSLKSANPATVT